MSTPSAILALTSVFQSSPTPKSRCYQGGGNACGPRVQVSILTHSEEQVLRGFDDRLGRVVFQFQSSPTPKSRCYA